MREFVHIVYTFDGGKLFEAVYQYLEESFKKNVKFSVIEDSSNKQKIIYAEMLDGMAMGKEIPSAAIAFCAAWQSPIRK